MKNQYNTILKCIVQRYFKMVFFILYKMSIYVEKVRANMSQKVEKEQYTLVK